MYKFILSLFVFIMGYFNISYAQNKDTIKKKDTTVIVTDNFSNSKKNANTHKSYTMTVDTNLRPVNLKYDELSALATAYFDNNNYSKASQLFEKAILENKGLGKIKDRFKLACCYAKLGNSDSAFVQLFRIVKSTKYYDIRSLENDVLLKALHADERWKQVIKIVEENLEKFNEETNQKLKNDN